MNFEIGSEGSEESEPEAVDTDVKVSSSGEEEEYIKVWYEDVNKDLVLIYWSLTIFNFIFYIATQTTFGRRWGINN